MSRILLVLSLLGPGFHPWVGDLRSHKLCSQNKNRGLVCMVVVMSEEFREKKDKNNTIKKNNTI